MLKRSLIRILFTLPILFSLAGWAWSSNHLTRAYYNNHPHGAMGVMTACGILDLGMSLQGNSTTAHGWHDENYPRPDIRWFGWPDNGNFPSQQLGFGFYCRDQVLDLRCPYYFLILLFSALLFLAWRHTRPRNNPATAFPVEMKAKP